ncbi:hypothetical protein GGP72_003318 [Salinibacter ruber]|uniref:Uncharacterized protein n=1 Tax=Salinibacter ruber TaxID=146919 RepID=A0A9X2Q196_9BACT|nr:hypothetical protein [Salinibacter ruber]MCS3679368.1 hypothetical protein [Salinibacter ruber]MCS3682654.1 hypothetical protein [Salinibacter ruber]
MSLYESTYAMWYNRLGWACFSSICIYVLYFSFEENLSILRLFGLFFLLSFLFYTKITYFLVSSVLIFTVGGTSLRRKKMAYFSLGSVFISALIMEGVFDGYMYGYVRDLVSAYQSSSSGAARGGLGKMVVYIASNSVLIISFLLSVLIYWYWRRRSWQKIVQMTLIFTGSWWLANQATGSVPISLATVPLWIADVSVSEEKASPNSVNLFGRDIPMVKTITFGLMIFATLPVAGKRLATLASYTDVGSTNYLTRTLDGFEELAVSEEELGEGLAKIGDSGLSLPSNLNKINNLSFAKTKTRVKVRGGDYIEYLKSAKMLLDGEVKDRRGVLVFDFVNAVNLFSKRKPLRGNLLWYHSGRTFSVEQLRSSDWLEKESYLMIPKVPLEYSSRNNMIKSSICELKNMYKLEAQNDLWILLERNTQVASGRC